MIEPANARAHALHQLITAPDLTEGDVIDVVASHDPASPSDEDYAITLTSRAWGRGYTLTRTARVDGSYHMTTMFLYEADAIALRNALTNRFPS